jgi:hypothetical protein
MSVVFGSVTPLEYPLPAAVDHSQLATHVILYCYPLYARQSLGVDVAPKVVVIDAAFVDHLMNQDHRERSSSADETEMKRPDVGARKCCIDLALEVGGSMLEHLLRSILSHLKYESTKSGVHLVLPGAVNNVYSTMYSKSCGLDPTVIPWPDSNAISVYASRFSRALSRENFHGHSQSRSGDEESENERSASKSRSIDENEHKNGGTRLWMHGSPQPQPESLRPHDGVTAHIRPLLGLVHISTENNDLPILSTSSQDSATASANASGMPSSRTARGAENVVAGSTASIPSHVHTVAPSMADHDWNRDYPLATRQYAKGTLLSFHGRLRRSRSVSAGWDLDMVVHAAGFHHAKLLLESKYVQYFICTLDPPHNFDDEDVDISPAKGDDETGEDEADEAELRRMWTALAEDDSLQHRVFLSACDHVNVLVLREKKVLEISHSLAELDLC